MAYCLVNNGKPVCLSSKKYGVLHTMLEMLGKREAVSFEIWSQTTSDVKVEFVAGVEAERLYKLGVKEFKSRQSNKALGFDINDPYYYIYQTGCRMADWEQDPNATAFRGHYFK